MSKFKYGDVLRLTDKFAAERGLPLPDPYRVMFVARTAPILLGSGCMAIVLAARDRGSWPQRGVVINLSERAFEKVND
jgi:hypothetical protein